MFTSLSMCEEFCGGGSGSGSGSGIGGDGSESYKSNKSTTVKSQSKVRNPQLY